MYIPKSVSDYKKLIWSFCRDCTGRERTQALDCTDSKCKLYPVYSMPRQLQLLFNFNEYLPEIIYIAIDISKKYDVFQLSTIRRKFYDKRGFDKLNWGSIVRRKEWLNSFEIAGECTSSNVRSHGDKVKLWRLKNNNYQSAKNRNTTDADRIATTAKGENKLLQIDNYKDAIHDAEYQRII